MFSHAVTYTLSEQNKKHAKTNERRYTRVYTADLVNKSHTSTAIMQHQHGSTIKFFSYTESNRKFIKCYIIDKINESYR